MCSGLVARWPWFVWRALLMYILVAVVVVVVVLFVFVFLAVLVVVTLVTQHIPCAVHLLHDS